MAGMFDLAVLILGSVIILLPSLLVFIGAMRGVSPTRTLAVYIVMFVTGGMVAIFDLIYRLAVPYFLNGQTLGLRFFRMRIVNEDGSEANLKSLLVKALTILFLVLFTFGLYYLVEAIAVFVSPSHRSFGDVISKTLVVDYDEMA